MLGQVNFWLGNKNIKATKMDLIYLVYKGSRMSAIFLEPYGLADWGEVRNLEMDNEYESAYS